MALLADLTELADPQLGLARGVQGHYSTDKMVPVRVDELRKAESTCRRAREFVKAAGKQNLDVHKLVEAASVIQRILEHPTEHVTILEQIALGEALKPFGYTPGAIVPVPESKQGMLDLALELRQANRIGSQIDDKAHAVMTRAVHTLETLAETMEDPAEDEE